MKDTLLNMENTKKMDNENVPKIKKITLYSGIMIILFLFFLVIWMLFAQLESAAIAPGSVEVANGRRIIQHYEGGIIKSILVKDGDKVKKSQLLIVLEDTQAKATSDINQNEWLQLLGAEARINAELNGNTLPAFPKALKDSPDSNAKDIMRVQQNLLEANQLTFKNSIEIYNQRIEQLTQEINGKQAEVTANIEQLNYINKELTEVEILAQKKLVKQSRLLALKREAAGLTGQQGELNATIAELKQKIGETRLQIIELKQKQRKDLLDELRETQRKLGEVTERRKTSIDILERTEIHSPIEGTVMNLKIHTIGGVIKAGEPIMDIVPAHEALIIEAKLNPLDIDTVHHGLMAKVVLTGLSQRNTPKLLGKVIDVSADTLTDPMTNKTYYNVRVEVPAKELKKIGSIALTPGMPAEVMIITKKATPWEYLTKPIIKSFDHSFRED